MQQCNCQVLDRTALILEIFSLRARSRQAQIQVELARLEYALPRLVQQHVNKEHHMRGGLYQSRGVGEMRSMLLKKRYQSRIADLKIILKQIELSQVKQQKRRNKMELKK